MECLECLELQKETFMPLLGIEKFEIENKIGVWQITEDLDFFINKINPDPTESRQLDKIKSKIKILEWYASRYLLHLLSNYKSRKPIHKDSFGKPYLEGEPKAGSTVNRVK